MNKAPPILALIARLPLEARGWVIVDHWSDDLCAIGFAPRAHPRHLIYVSTYDKEAGRYFYECETPSGAEPTDYVASASGEGVDLDTLLAAMEEHFALAQETRA
jgi:hypothetical protein